MTAPERIDALKAKGFKVRVRVLRYVGGVPVLRGRDGVYPGAVDPRGGVVIVEIENAEGRSWQSESRCFPGGTNAKGKAIPGDNFNKRYGLSKALGRAIQQSYEAKEIIRGAEA